MAADSATTITRRDVTRVLTGVRKLQVIEKLGAAISIWGAGEIDDTDSDVWLDKFIRGRQNEYDSLESFATLLQNELRRLVPRIDLERDPEGTIGFHLAGFVDLNGRKAPTFYHIHNGRSMKLEARGETVDGTTVNANHDILPEEACGFIDRGGIYVVHNGDYEIYKEVFNYLRGFFAEVERKTGGGMLIPYSVCLADREEWLRFQIATISALYSFAGLDTPNGPVKLPTIGGPVTSLRISRQYGIESYVTRS